MALVVDSLTKDYPTRSGPLAVLRGISLSLAPGEALAIMGASGSGKSTLLQILGTLDRPSGGRITLENQDPFQLDDSALAAFRNRRIGFVFQDHHLLPQFNVLENVLLPALVHRESSAEAYAKELLEKVGLGHRLDHRPAELSGGERQRVAIARALVLKPMLVLADEPTGNLDRKNAEAVGQLLLNLHREQRSILLAVTHSPDLAAKFPRTLEMLDGTLSNPRA
jgi:lipoprotein-releasing system ATP-binding protein